MFLVKGDCRFSDEVTLHEMKSGREAVKMWGAGGAGVKKIVEMKVPKRWFARRSECVGPEQSVLE